MSKKCCGIIYNENEKFCTTCGKPLKDLPDILDMAEVDRIAASVMGENTADTPKVQEESKSEETEKTDSVQQDTVTQESKVDDVADEYSDKESDEIPVQDEQEQDDNKEEKHKDKSSDENEDEDEEDEEEYDDGTASAGLKFFGTLMILLMLAAIAAVVLGVYFIMLNPFYKNHDVNKPVVYEQMATDTDVTNIQSRPALIEVSIEPATPIDASSEDIATDGDATATDATEESDDDDDNEDDEASEESEDME
ncbi:MAG: hypothetical protein IKJ73_12425 [Lachnospiraceae bacterium]|nr:hypothetical protein [Lachnospiraceae bacterium]